MTREDKLSTIDGLFADKLMNFTSNFQWGSDRELPPTPAEYKADLAATAKTLDVNFPNDVDETAIIDNAAAVYEGLYGQILKAKPPLNAPDGFREWWDKTHTKPYLSYPGVV